MSNNNNNQNQPDNHYYLPPNSSSSPPTQQLQPSLPDGHLLGTTPDGTPVYSNSWKIKPRRTPLFEQTGDGKSIKFECVQLSRLWLWNFYGLILPSITLAAQIFYLPYLLNENEQQVPLRAIRNGSHEKPVKNSIIIYASHPSNLTGHIGVIVDVKDEGDTKQVRVACQNRYSEKFAEGTYWNKSYPLQYDSERLTWTIIDPEEPVVGWMIPVFDGNMKKTFEDHRHQVLKSKEAHQVKEVIGPGEKIEPMRPLPQRFLDGKFPEYDSSITKAAWWNLFMEFAPVTVWFPTYFRVVTRTMTPVSKVAEGIMSLFSKSKKK